MNDCKKTSYAATEASEHIVEYLIFAARRLSMANAAHYHSLIKISMAPRPRFMLGHLAAMS